jgi:hypothetical protein
MKTILHLCADLGSDSRPYQLANGYKVILIGKDIGVENYSYIDNGGGEVYGIIANPVCTDFSTAKGYGKQDIESGMVLVNHCIRIIDECKPKFWVIENPATGLLKDVIGKPRAIYQPWQYGSPWTKKTALWGDFVMPPPLFKDWADVPKNENLYVRPSRGKPSLAFLHKSAINHIKEFEFAKDFVKTDADFRSLCSQGFANEFFKYNP